MACCPFHNDKTPSMKLDRRYHCFGCGADGDVIDFAAALYGLGKKEAAVQLAQDFGLSYEDWKPPGKAKKPKPRQKSPEEQFQEAKNRPGTGETQTTGYGTLTGTCHFQLENVRCFSYFQGGIDLNVFEAVKQSVTTRQAAEHYGIHVGRNGKIGRAHV